MMRQPEACPYLTDMRARWDGELAPARAAEVAAHLEGCPTCQQEQRALEHLAAALRAGDTDMSIPKPRHERLAKGAKPCGAGS